MLVCILCKKIIVNTNPITHYGVCEQCNVHDLTKEQEEIIKKDQEDQLREGAENHLGKGISVKITGNYNDEIILCYKNNFGVAHVTCRGTTAFIDDFAIGECGKGHGRRFYGRIEEDLRKCYKSIECEVAESYGERERVAIAFWRAMGFLGSDGNPARLAGDLLEKNLT